MRRGCPLAAEASAANGPAEKAFRCRKAADPATSGPNGAAKAAAKKAPGIESGGASPAVDATLPLLRPGTFRLDIAAFDAVHPIFGIGPPHDSRNDLYETFTLGYGVTPRFTVFAGALEVNSDHDNGPYQATYVDPKAGFIYRLATAPEFRGATLDFTGDVTVNEPVAGPTSAFGRLPLSQLGPVGRARVLVTRQFGPSFTLEGIGGFQTAQVKTDYPFGGLSHTTTDVDALLGLAGQYHLGFISDRLYVNGELDYMKPLTDDVNQLVIDTPFKTTETYAATLGASYVLVPGSIIIRATDTVALDLASPQELVPVHYAGRELYNTIGVTLSFCNLEPGRWLKGAAP